jgi:hypothetical protein
LDTFVTSAAKVAMPGIFDLLNVCCDNRLRLPQLSSQQTVTAMPYLDAHQVSEVRDADTPEPVVVTNSSARRRSRALRSAHG